AVLDRRCDRPAPTHPARGDPAARRRRLLVGRGARAAGAERDQPAGAAAPCPLEGAGRARGLSFGGHCVSVHIAPIACRDLVELVTDYLEGALSPEQHARFEKHIAGWDGCTAYLEQMRETIRLTGTLREQQISSSALAALL